MTLFYRKKYRVILKESPKFCYRRGESHCDPTRENQPNYPKAFLSVESFEEKKGNNSKSLKFCDIRSVRFTATTEPGDKTAVRFTRVSNNDVINKNNLKVNFFKNTLLFHTSIKFFQNLKKELNSVGT